MNLVERLTDAEEKLRDGALAPMLNLLIPSWVRPNHITGLRLLLVITAIIFYLISYPLNVQIWILTAAALTDFIDGPLARLRGLSSRKGAYLDQVTDWCLGAWSGVLSLITGLLPLAVIVLMVVPQVGVFVTDRIRAARLSSSSSGERVLTIAMGAANFRPTTIARLQFVTVLLGFMLLLVSKVTGSAACRRLGLFSLYLEILLVWLLLLYGIVKVAARN
ncbi:MAG TPA: CDP-alcohol phosphatidyltransferase family protein [Bacillota bacterium]|nr:CDP-alcohol phosphatidyltransferase family protein [Bacillota bacterium]